MCIALIDAVEAHIAARQALVDTPVSRLSADDARFAAVTETLGAMVRAVALAKAREVSSAYEFAADFVAHIERSDTDDLDFGRGLVSVGLIEKARAVLSGAPA